MPLFNWGYSVTPRTRETSSRPCSAPAAEAQSAATAISGAVDDNDGALVALGRKD